MANFLEFLKKSTIFNEHPVYSSLVQVLLGKQTLVAKVKLGDHTAGAAGVAGVAGVMGPS